MNEQQIGILILISPLVIGGIIAAINSTAINKATESVEAATRSRQNKTAAGNSKLSRYVTNPILYAIVLFCNWTDGFKHRGLKNGARVAVTLYLIAAWVWLLYLALVLVVIGTIIYIAILIMSNKNSNDTESSFNSGKNFYSSNESEPEPQVMDYVGNRGNKTYS